MNEHQLDLDLSVIGADRTRVSAPPDLRPIVLAIPSTTPQQRGFLPPLTRRFQSMFSATKFVVAGAIVALFGGFLLAGVLTQPSDESMPAVGASASASAMTQAEPTDAATSEPEPTSEVEADDTATTPVHLPGLDLVTEEIEPGVYRVVSDGVRDLVRIPEEPKGGNLGGILDGHVVAGLDGSVWWFGTDGFYRLGEDAEHRWPKNSEHPPVGYLDIEVGPDGTVWLADWDDISSYDGQAWSKRWRGTKKRSARDVEVQPDGTVWMAWVTGPADRKGSVRAARLGDDDWEALPGSVQNRDRGNYNDLLNYTDLIVSDEGDTPLVRAIQRLRRHDGDDWVVQPTPDAGRTMRADVGPDGTLWVRLNPECRPSPCQSELARFDGEDWVVYGPSDGIPMMGDHYQGFEGFFEVARDRSVWFNPIGDYERGIECDGVANFDGEAVTYFLRDICIYAMDIAPDGTVWLQAGEFPDADGFPIHLYVITPEAVVE